MFSLISGVRAQKVTIAPTIPKATEVVMQMLLPYLAEIIHPRLMMMPLITAASKYNIDFFIVVSFG